MQFCNFLQWTPHDHTQVNTTDRNVRHFPGAPIDNELLRKVIDAHDPNRTDLVDYSVFLTGKKFINKLFLVGAVKVTITHGDNSRKQFVYSICFVNLFFNSCVFFVLQKKKKKGGGKKGKRKKVCNS